MSLLRNSFDQNIVDQERANFLQEQADAQGMGALRRGWNAGRVGGDLNAARIDEAAALAAGDAQKAALLGQQREYLEQRQALYAPEVGKVEDIRGIGDALGWAGTQVGQGVASTADSVALGAAGAALGRLPGAFKLAPLAAGIGSFALNQRQMAGEHVGRLREDPAAMASLGAKGVYDQANLVGAAGGALETVFPFAVGRAFGGAALRQGAGGLMGRSFGAKTLGGMAVEGGTEVAQGEIGRFMHTDANPLRKTEGDWSDRLNEFAGGAVGSGPMSAAGAAADMAYGGTARAGEAVKEKAGEVVDMAAEKAKQAYEKTGLKGVVDLGTDGSKSVWETVKELFGKGVDAVRDAKGNVNWAESAERMKQRYDAYKLDAATYDQLDPTNEANLTSEGYSRRGDIVYEKLLGLADGGDARAEQLLDGLSSDDPAARINATDEASVYLREQSLSAKVDRRVAVLKASAGNFIQKTSGNATHAVQKAAQSAVFVGMNAAEGVRKALGSDKKNMQSTADLAVLDYDTWMTWRKNAYEGAMREIGTKDAQDNEMQRAFADTMADTLSSFVVARNALGDADQERTNDLRFMGRTIGYEMAYLAHMMPKPIDQKSKGTHTNRHSAQAQEFVQNSTAVIDSIAEDLRDLAPDSYMEGVQALVDAAPPEQQPFFDLLVERLNTPPQQLAMTRDQLETQLLQQLKPEQRQELMKERGAAAGLRETITAVVRGQATPTQRAQLEKELGAENVRAMTELVAGVEPAPRSARLADDRLQGAEVVDPDRLSMNDDGEVTTDGEFSDFDQARAERKLQNNSAPPVFGFIGEKSHTMTAPDPRRRNYRNPFTADKDNRLPRLARVSGIEGDTADESQSLKNRVTALEKQLGVARTPEAYFETAANELRAEFASGKRSVTSARKNDTQPELAAGVATGGVAAAAKARKEFDRLKELNERYKAGDPEAIKQAQEEASKFFETRAGHWAVETASAWDMMKELNLNDNQRVNIFAGYMKQEAEKEGRSPAEAEKFQRLQNLAMRRAADMANGLDYKKPGKGVKRTDARVLAPPQDVALLEKAMERYFKQGHLAIARQKSERAELQMTNAELMTLVKDANNARSAVGNEARKADAWQVTNSLRQELESRILNFPQAEGKNLMGATGDKGKGAALSIKAGELVKWVRLNRQADAPDTNSWGDQVGEEKAWLRDLSEGITSVIGTGVAAGMPYVLNREGKAEYFGEGGRLPPSMALPYRSGELFNKQKDGDGTPSSWKAMSKEQQEQARAERGSDDARDNSFYQARVARDILKTDDLSDGGGFEAAEIAGDASTESTMDPYGDIKKKATNWQRNFDELQSLGVEFVAATKALEKASASGNAVSVAAAQKKVADVSARIRGVERRLELASERDKPREMGDQKDLARNARRSKIAEAVANRRRGDERSSDEDNYLAAGLRNNRDDLREGQNIPDTAEEQGVLEELRARTGDITKGLGRETQGYVPEIAKARAEEIFVTKNPKDNLGEDGKLERVTAEIDFVATMVNIQRRIDAATNYARLHENAGKAKDQGPGKNGGYTEKQEAAINAPARLKGMGKGGRAFAQGPQYLYPLAHALSVKQVGALIDSGELSEGRIDYLIGKQRQVARLIVDSTLHAGVQLQLARAMGEGQGISNYAEAKAFLEGLADKPMNKRVTLKATAAPEVAAQGPKSQPPQGGAAKGKLNAQATASDAGPVRQLNKRLVGLLAERGIKVEESALDHVPPEMRVSLVNRTLMADLKEPLAEDVAKFLSWMTLGSGMYQKIADGIAGTSFEKAILSEVNRDARQSMYTPVRKQREVVRRAVERLLTNGLLKKHASEAPLPLRVVQMVRSAIKGIMGALGGVKYKDLQGLADQYVDDLLSGKVTLERPRQPGSVRVIPYEVFGADQHAADLTFALTDGGGFALTGSLAYASQGTVYRPKGMAIHDLDFTTSLPQRGAEQRLERLYPQAHKVRSFGGMGDFVSTYVVPPKNHKVDLVAVKDGVVRAFVVRDASGKIVGRYTNNGMGESSSGVKGTVVDLISDKRGAASKLTIPTSFGDKQVPIADVAHAMAQKLMYARDKDITDFANFVPNGRGRKLNAQGTKASAFEAEKIRNAAAAELMGMGVPEDDAYAQAHEELMSGAFARTNEGKRYQELNKPADPVADKGAAGKGRSAAEAYAELRGIYESAAADTGITAAEAEAAFDNGTMDNEFWAGEYRNFVNSLSEQEVVAFFEKDPKERARLLRELDAGAEVSEDSPTDEELLAAELPSGGREPLADPQEPPKSAPGEAEGEKVAPGTQKAQKRAARHVPTDDDIAAAKEYLNRVLGKQIRTDFKEITGYSGQWIEDENVIEVSTLTLAGALNVARHEALHAFFSKFIAANPKAIGVLSSLTDDPRILRRLQALLKDDPNALEQLQDGEERLAYIYQFAMAGQLKLPHTPGTTLMGKIRKFLRRVFMMVRDDERAVDLLYAFEGGQMSKPDAAAKAIAKAINQGTWAKKVARGMDAVTQGAAAMVLPANTILANSVSPTARELAKMFFTNPGEEGAAEGGTGYLNERNQKMRTYNNLFRSAIENLDDRQLKELTEAMQNETPTGQLNDPDVAQAKENLHALFERFHVYLKDEKGLRVGKIRENYFPAVYDPDAVREGLRPMLTSDKYMPEMRKMVAAINEKVMAANSALPPGAEPQPLVTVEQVVDGIVNHITRDNPSDDIEMEPKRHDGVLRPWFAGGERRVLFFLDPADRAKLQEKDLVMTVTRYLRQGVRAAEYSSRFGRNGQKLSHNILKDGRLVERGMLADIKQELEEESLKMLARGDLKNEKAREKWASRQYRDVARAVGAMEGSLGHDVSEFVRKVNSASIVYQNIRLLPMALFSSFVDPLGIVARGGEMREAWDTFARGIKGVARQWADMLREQPPERQKDQWERLAELAGVVDSATFSHLLTDEYGSVYMGSFASRMNERMFKTNGMEAWNRSMRVGATKAAVAFIERHNTAGEQHSARWMKDLGLEPGTLKLDDEGHLIVDKRDLLEAFPDMELSEAEAYIGKVHAAINRWVESAILSPNAAQRPAWGSDPHFGMFWHLKQFAYSFHETIMKRAIGEAKQGNYAPLGIFAWYIPVMIAADVTKGLMLGAGELPGYMKNYDLGDWMMHGVKRSGTLGIGDIGVEALKDPTSLGGPTVEQATDFFFKPLEDSIIKALPANALYARALQ